MSNLFATGGLLNILVKQMQRENQCPSLSEQDLKPRSPLWINTNAENHTLHDSVCSHHTRFSLLFAGVMAQGNTPPHLS